MKKAILYNRWRNFYIHWLCVYKVWMCERFGHRKFYLDLSGQTDEELDDWNPARDRWGCKRCWCWESEVVN